MALLDEAIPWTGAQAKLPWPIGFVGEKRGSVTLSSTLDEMAAPGVGQSECARYLAHRLVRPFQPGADGQRAARGLASRA